MKSTSPTATPASVAAAVDAAVLAKHPIRAIRRAAVPIAAFETSDPAATIAACKRALNGKFDKVPVLQWDLLRGFVGLNKLGVETASDMGGETALNPAEALSNLAKVDDRGTPKIPAGSLCFMLNAHRLIGDSSVAQGFWNVRDVWKQQGASLILLCPTLKLPDELAHDIVVVTEPLPTPDEIGLIVDAVIASVSTPENPIKVGDKSKVVDALLGVSAFAAEQALAMSITKAGIDPVELWNRKRKMVEQTPGLSVWQGKDSFGDIGGLDNLKNFLGKVMTSEKNPVRAILYIDEIEKMFSGNSDTSGVSQDQLRVFLTTMQDEDLAGVILIGAPGTGKSAIAKAAGSFSGAEVISCDTGAMTGSLVGESHAKIRKAMQTFSAVSQKKGIVMATCNSITTLPPELRRRFSLGVFYVPLPSNEERLSIWKLWIKKYGHATDSELPNHTGWTGAEIKACCDVASRTGLSLVEASTFIVPVSVSAPEKIEALCKSAHKKFISASVPGLYDYEAERTAAAQMGVPVKVGRRIELGDN